VEPPDMALFHSLYMEIRAQDLDLFAEVLDRAEHSEPADEILAFVDRRIDETSDWLRTLDKRIDAAYVQAGLIYDADLNPFIC
jgi:anaerobic magnesium-protoporphyrin IX monomethyl ester cyclase